MSSCVRPPVHSCNNQNIVISIDPVLVVVVVAFGAATRFASVVRPPLIADSQTIAASPFPSAHHHQLTEYSSAVFAQ